VKFQQTGCQCHEVQLVIVLTDADVVDGQRAPISVRSKPDTDRRSLAVWLSGNALASINVVALRQTRLVLEWVTVCGRVNHLGT